jgi:FkbM family methyltransferase
MSGILSAGLRLTNRALALLGLRLQHLPAPTRSFGDFLQLLKHRGIDVATVVDVGVAHGTPSLYRAFPAARFVLVEPVTENKANLERAMRGFDHELIWAAAGAVNGTAIINVHNDLSGSSLLRQAEGTGADGTPRSIPMVRLDGVLGKPPARPCLVKIDTQGTELEVVAGLGDRLRDVDVFIVETSMFRFRQGAAEIADVVIGFQQLGFVIYDILEGHMRALDGALAQVDLVFVPADSPLRNDPRFFSEEQLQSYQAKWAGTARKP